MKQVPVTNNEKKPIYVGGKQVLPGETRTVGDIHMPKPRKILFDVLLILAATVKEIVSKLTLYSDEELGMLLDSERQYKNRAGVVSAITDVLAERDYAGGIDSFKGSLVGLTQDELEALLLQVADDNERYGLVVDAIELLQLTLKAGNAVDSDSDNTIGGDA